MLFALVHHSFQSLKVSCFSLIFTTQEVDCEEVLAELETIDDDLSEIGIIFVTTEDSEVATANGECSPLADGQK